MRVCLIGDYSGDPDEGLKNIAKHLASSLEDQGHSVHRANVTHFPRPKFFQDIYSFDPDIIHYIPGISLKNVVLTRGLCLLTGAEVVISAVDADTHNVSPTLLGVFGPSLIFSQDDKLEELVEKSGRNYCRVPNGVDISKFTPISDSQQNNVREKYDIDPDEFVVLHVGHLTEKRNLEALIEVQQDGYQVVIAASNFFEEEDELVNKLRDAGCRIIRGYVPDIERLYAVTDCYVFPTVAGDTIQMPLSVLEAMSCNLPVVTQEHPGITDLFSSGNGLYIESSDRDLVERVNEIARVRPTVDTRSKVRPYSWNRIAEKVIDEYRKVLHGHSNGEMYTAEAKRRKSK